MLKKDYRKKKTPKYFYVAALGVFLFLGIGYSVITTTLSFKGNVTAAANKWDIYFDNVSENAQSFVTITDGTQLSYNVTLNNPGDKIDFTVDVVNNGTLNALIKTMDITSLTSEQQKYINYAVEYEDGSPIELNDLLKKKSSRKIHVLVEYKKLKATDMYPEDDINLTMNINLNYYQPKDEYNHLLIKSPEETIEEDILNTEQEYVFSSYPDSNYVAVKCYNGAKAVTENGVLKIQNIKEETTCYLNESIAEAINNENQGNVTLIQNTIESSNISIDSGTSITLDLNGYTLSGTFDYDIQLINVVGNLNIKDSKGTGKISSNYRVIANTGTLNINGGTYERQNDNTNTNAGGVISSTDSGIVNIKNANIISDRVWAVYACRNATININNSVVESTDQATTIAMNSDADEAQINIKNSTIKNDVGEVFSSSSTAKGILSICNSSIESPTYDFANFNIGSTVLYSSNSIFRNGTNNPTILNGSHSYILKTDTACGE